VNTGARVTSVASPDMHGEGGAQAGGLQGDLGAGLVPIRRESMENCLYHYTGNKDQIKTMNSYCALIG
jgi:hypothetical protein